MMLWRALGWVWGGRKADAAVQEVPGSVVGAAATKASKQELQKAERRGDRTRNHAIDKTGQTRQLRRSVRRVRK